MARGTKDFKYGMYDRQVSRDVQQEKHKALVGGVGPQGEGGTSKCDPQKEIENKKNHMIPLEDTKLDLSEDDFDITPSEDNHKERQGLPANQFSNDLNKVSVKSKNEVQQTSDGMTEYFEEQMSAHGNQSLLPDEKSTQTTSKEMTEYPNKLKTNAALELNNITLKFSKQLTMEPDTTTANASVKSPSVEPISDSSGKHSCVDVGSSENEDVEPHGKEDTAGMETINTDYTEPLTDISGPDKRRGINISAVKSTDVGKQFMPETYSTSKKEDHLQDQNVCPSGNTLVPDIHPYVEVVRELGYPQQLERLEPNCKYKKGIFHVHGDITWKGAEECLSYSDTCMNKESVGFIQRDGFPIGSCFRVGKEQNGFLLTAFHVFSNIFPPQIGPTDDTLPFLSNGRVRVCFPDKKENYKLYDLKPKFHSGCPKLDYALLELKGEVFPRPFENIGSVTTESQNFIHSYHGSDLQFDDKVRVLNVSEEDVQYASKHCKDQFNFIDPYKHQVTEVYQHSILDKEKVPIITRLRHGASGGPGFHIDDAGKPVVTFMFLRGYPTQYYRLPVDQLVTFPSCLLIEQGLRMIEIYNSVKYCCKELAEEIFQFH